MELLIRKKKELFTLIFLLCLFNFFIVNYLIKKDFYAAEHELLVSSSDSRGMLPYVAVANELSTWANKLIKQELKKDSFWRAFEKQDPHLIDSRLELGDYREGLVTRTKLTDPISVIVFNLEIPYVANVKNILIEIVSLVLIRISEKIKQKAYATNKDSMHSLSNTIKIESKSTEKWFLSNMLFYETSLKLIKDSKFSVESKAKDLPDLLDRPLFSLDRKKIKSAIRLLKEYKKVKSLKMSRLKAILEKKKNFKFKMFSPQTLFVLPNSENVSSSKQTQNAIKLNVLILVASTLFATALFMLIYLYRPKGQEEAS